MWGPFEKDRLISHSKTKELQYYVQFHTSHAKCFIEVSCRQCVSFKSQHIEMTVHCRSAQWEVSSSYALLNAAFAIRIHPCKICSEKKKSANCTYICFEWKYVQFESMLQCTRNQPDTVILEPCLPIFPGLTLCRKLFQRTISFACPVWGGLHFYRSQEKIALLYRNPGWVHQ